MSTFFFFFNDTATTEIYTLSLHDALPICEAALPQYAELHCLSNFTFPRGASHPHELVEQADSLGYAALAIDRKSTRLNSSHLVISYAVFCLKKKRTNCVHLEVHPSDTPSS